MRALIRVSTNGFDGAARCAQFDDVSGVTNMFISLLEFKNTHNALTIQVGGKIRSLFLLNFIWDKWNLVKFECPAGVIMFLLMYNYDFFACKYMTHVSFFH